MTSPTFTQQRLNGFYDGPFILGRDGPDAVVRHFDEVTGAGRVSVLESSADGSVSLGITFYQHPEDPRKNFTTTVAFVREPDDWDNKDGVRSVDHHIIGSTQFGCMLQCMHCVDGPPPWQANLPAEYMAYAAHRVIREAEKIVPIATDASIRLLQTGSGDPFANHKHVAEFIRHARLVDQRISRIFTSTAGVIGGALREIADAAVYAKDNHGLIVDSQFSLHKMGPARKELVRRPQRTTDLQLIAAAAEFSQRTGNRALLNYAVIPGWNNNREDAEALVAAVPSGAALKVVGNNPHEGLSSQSAFLHVECTDEHVAEFAGLLVRMFGDSGKNVTVMTPKDRAAGIGAACGTVGQHIYAGLSC